MAGVWWNWSACTWKSCSREASLLPQEEAGPGVSVSQPAGSQDVKHHKLKTRPAPVPRPALLRPEQALVLGRAVASMWSAGSVGQRLGTVRQGLGNTRRCPHPCGGSTPANLPSHRAHRRRLGPALPRWTSRQGLQSRGAHPPAAVRRTPRSPCPCLAALPSSAQSEGVLLSLSGGAAAPPAEGHRVLT